MPDVDILSTNDVATEVVGLLLDQQLVVGVAESLTGGQLTTRLVEVPGSGDVVAGGLVAYFRDVKHNVLGVPEGPVVSAEAATAMARGATELFGCEVGLSVTGVAGPATQDDKPVGTVYAGWSVDGEVETAKFAFPNLDAAGVRAHAAEAALNALRLRLLRRLSSGR